MAALAADPAHLAEARRTVDATFPVGTYRKMMGGNFTKMMEGMSSRMLDMPVRDLVAMGGMSAEETARMSDATMRQVMEILDPAFEQRNKAMFDTMIMAMADIMNDLEPEIRVALADAYAGRFTMAQLQDLNRFFATPTGKYYAENAMTLAMDPAFTDKIMKLTPRIMEAMPRIVKSAMAQTKGLPPRESYGTLSPADRERLGKLLSLPPAEAEKAVNVLEKQQRKQDAGAS
ncbi:DUF2059 domain-containing protein [Sphingobium sufflavum]|uniref:DUF2059 domain-containing protein n=1 Tax=Sphingobium sufflavum TaxID=1129547 RepID=UPI001F3E9EFE|nr:DUF2059 domain-containing protein [Sphingobium sufflavum]MCE7796590.1 DUF2059 domain-containing protein [Sphingobium sufflavum]